TFNWPVRRYRVPATIPPTSWLAAPAAVPTRSARKEPDAPAPSTTCELLQFTQSVMPASKSGFDSRFGVAAAAALGMGVNNAETRPATSAATPAPPPPQALSAAARATAPPATRTARVENSISMFLPFDACKKVPCPGGLLPGSCSLLMADCAAFLVARAILVRRGLHDSRWPQEKSKQASWSSYIAERGIRAAERGKTALQRRE